jgi:cysteine desulfurase/selenocysteine lyase
MLAARVGATIKVIPMSDAGELDMGALDGLLSARTRLVGVVHVSNALGTINPVAEIAERAHAVGAKVLVDGCQATSHVTVDVGELGADFYAFSAHKMLGPTGMGALWARAELLEELPPFMGGGDMISSVGWDETTYNEIPYKYEAGTPPIQAAVGWGAACDYLNGLGRERVAAREDALLAEATERLLTTIPNARVIGTAARKAAVLSFAIGDIHPHDIGSILNSHGVAIRTGHHCTEPLMRRLGLPGTARASFACYSSSDDIDRFIEGLEIAVDLLG